MSAGLPLYKHAAPLRELSRRYRAHVRSRDYRLRVMESAVFFAASVVVSFFAIQYATERASNPVTDLFLSNVPIMDIDGFFVFGTVLLIIFTTLLLISHPKRVPFVLNSLALFYMIRSAFVVMTHMGPFPIPPAEDWGTLASHFLFGADRFFSAHTGVPFLLALTFWRERGLRTIYLLWSVYMGTIVLLGHYHYSIDVASAFFITYTIYHMALRLFPADHARLIADEAASS